MKSSNIGGQAVLEGIMMRSGSKYAVAVRRPDGEIEVKVDTYRSVSKWKSLTKLPFIRGIFGFIDSMVLGMKTLNYSATFIEEDEEDAVVLTEEEAKKRAKRDDAIMAVVLIVSMVFAMGLFMVLPYYISLLFGSFIKSRLLKTVIEAVVRIGIFIAYILLVSLMKDIQRTFMYHGAEHKCINCIESGLALNVDNVRKSSKQHKRCGTSFLFFVVLVSVIVCFFITVQSPVLRVLIRIALIPLIAGISFELIKLAGSSNNPVVQLLSVPGLAMQKLTTKEPDDDMIEVAIRAVEAVFDWKAYLKENFGIEVGEEADDTTESI